MFFLNMVDYPVFFPMLSTMTWNTFLILRGSWGLGLLSEPCTPTQTFKKLGVGGLGGGGPYDFSDSPGIWNLDWTLALGLSILLSNPFLVRKYFFLIINCQA